MAARTEVSDDCHVENEYGGVGNSEVYGNGEKCLLNTSPYDADMAVTLSVPPEDSKIVTDSSSQQTGEGIINRPPSTGKVEGIINRQPSTEKGEGIINQQLSTGKGDGEVEGTIIEEAVNRSLPGDGGVLQVAVNRSSPGEPADDLTTKETKRTGKKRRRGLMPPPPGESPFPPRHVIVAAANGDWQSTKILHELSNLDICEMLRQETGMNYVKHKLSKLHLMSRLFKVFAGKGPYNQRTPRLLQPKASQDYFPLQGGSNLPGTQEGSSPEALSEEYETSAEEEGGDMEMEANTLDSVNPWQHNIGHTESQPWPELDDTLANSGHILGRSGCAGKEGETMAVLNAGDVGKPLPTQPTREKETLSEKLSLMDHVLAIQGSKNTNRMRKNQIRSGTGVSNSMEAKRSPLSTVLPPTPSGAEPLRKPRGKSKPRDEGMFRQVMQTQNGRSLGRRQCPNLNCGKTFGDGEEFCVSCDCYMCYLSSGIKHGSGEWIQCKFARCGLWAHLECAYNRQLAGVWDFPEDPSSTSDASYRCGGCRTTVSLLRTMRDLLESAHSARIVETLRLKLHLAQRLLQGSRRFHTLSTQVNMAVKTLEAGIGSIASPQGAKDAVRRHSAALKVQAILGNILELVDSELEETAPNALISEEELEEEGGEISDSECFQCGDGGTLLMCDGGLCRKAFHLECLGMETIPTGNWLCTSCRRLLGPAVKRNEGTLETPFADERPPPPTNLHFLDIRPTSVVVAWDAPHLNVGNGEISPITGYKVWHKKRDEVSYGPPPCTPPYMTAVTVTGLDPGSLYCFKVAAVTSHGTDGFPTEEGNCQTSVAEQRPKYTRKRPSQLVSRQCDSSGLDSSSPNITTDEWNGSQGVIAEIENTKDTCGKDSKVDNEDSKGEGVRTQTDTVTESLVKGGERGEGESMPNVDSNPPQSQPMKNILTIRKVEKLGHITRDFRVKFFSWMTLHASEEEKDMVSFFVNALGCDDLQMLGEQLIDTFSEVVNNSPKKVKADPVKEGGDDEKKIGEGEANGAEDLNKEVKGEEATV